MLGDPGGTPEERVLAMRVQQKELSEMTIERFAMARAPKCQECGEAVSAARSVLSA